MMRQSWISFEALLILIGLNVVAFGASSGGIQNSCQVSQENCKYLLSFQPTESQCHFLSSYESAAGSRYIQTPLSSSNLSSSEDVSHTSRRLDQLEQKLVRMMEDLSIRSLRHIRQIKLDVRQIMTSVRDLRSKQPRPGGGSQGSGAGGGGGGNGAGRAGVPCLPEFVRVGPWPSCYRFSLFNATWHEAREYCSAFGANLLALDSLKEAHIIDYLIKSNPEYQESDSWWTSGNYMVRNQRWMWTSKHHLKPISYSRWAPGESEAKANMHCMLLYKPMKYYWREAVCNDKNTFICEMEL